MKRQLIETKRESLIQCDNTNCDFTIPYSASLEKNMLPYINMPCPKCGDNLLTEEDFLLDQKLMRTIAWVNKWFSWITFFYSKKTWNKRSSVSVHVHDGVKIKDECE
jgi:hypothetical protein